VNIGPDYYGIVDKHIELVKEMKKNKEIKIAEELKKQKQKQDDELL
jgi:hypothetical protein